MFLCTRKGCGKWFESSYGLLVHLRACAHDDCNIQKHTEQIRKNGIERKGNRPLNQICAESIDVEGSIVGNPGDIADMCNELVPYSKNRIYEQNSDERLVSLLMLHFEKLGRGTSKR